MPPFGGGSNVAACLWMALGTIDKEGWLYAGPLVVSRMIVRHSLGCLTGHDPVASCSTDVHVRIQKSLCG